MKNSKAEMKFNSMPLMSSSLMESNKTGFGLFMDLWAYSLAVDGEGTVPSIRINLEPKTLFVPHDFSMAHLVPLDLPHPLYLKGDNYTTLRREFILDHLVLDAIDGFDNASTSGLSTTVLTLSGKELIIHRSDSGDITVGGVNTTRPPLLLEDGALVFILEEPLFNLAAKIREVFNEIHAIEVNAPLGPPLDIDGAVPPPLSEGDLKAPAPPPLDFLHDRPAPVDNTLSDSLPILPPAPPPVNRLVLPPAPPPSNRIVSPPAPPVPSLVEPSPPAPPPDALETNRISKSNGNTGLQGRSPSKKPEPKRIFSVKPLPIAGPSANPIERIEPIAETNMKPIVASASEHFPDSVIKPIAEPNIGRLEPVGAPSAPEPASRPVITGLLKSGSDNSGLQIAIEPIAEPNMARLEPIADLTNLEKSPADLSSPKETFKFSSAPEMAVKPIAAKVELLSPIAGPPGAPVARIEPIAETEFNAPAAPVPISEPILPPAGPESENNRALPKTLVSEVIAQPNTRRAEPPSAPIAISEPILPPVPPSGASADDV